MTPIIDGEQIANEFLKEKLAKSETDRSPEQMHRKIVSAVEAQNYREAHALIEMHLENELHNKEAEGKEAYSRKYREDGKDKEPQPTRYQKDGIHTEYST